MTDRDTIAAIATAAGAAGIGVIRLSGPRAPDIAAQFLGQAPKPRYAHYARFLELSGEIIDDGLLIAFPAPRSFTGEDVVELQIHGSPVLLQRLLHECCARGARPARPGEFTERAFLNGKLDLAQAEAIADLIAAGSESAARAARRSLDGVFSRRVDALVEGLTGLRVWLEAALDFPEEEIDFLAAPELQLRLDDVRRLHTDLLREAERGQRLRDGLHVVILGAPNAGKSSLLNALAGSQRAIVTPIAGTTRDVLREVVRIDGMELTLADTAGLRHTSDEVEAEGIRRAEAETERADLVLAVLDDRVAATAQANLQQRIPIGVPVLWIHSHADLTRPRVWEETRADGTHLWLSTTGGDGLDALRGALRRHAGQGDGTEGAFSARARHVEALKRAGEHLQAATKQLRQGQGELAADDLRLAQEAVGEITGRLSADALLGKIFGSFCIGK